MQGHWRLSPSRPLKLHLLTFAGLIRSLSNGTVRRGVSEEKMTGKTTYYVFLLPHKGFICFVPPHTPWAQHLVDTQYNLVEWMNEWIVIIIIHSISMILYILVKFLCTWSHWTLKELSRTTGQTSSFPMTMKWQMQRVKVFCPASQS